MSAKPASAAALDQRLALHAWLAPHVRRHPEWWTVLLAGVAWMVLLAGHLGTGSIGHDHAAERQVPVAVSSGDGHHHKAATVATVDADARMALPLKGVGRGMADWTLMSMAMMVPVTLPVLRFVGLNSVRSRRNRGMAIYLAAYLGVWIGFGIVVLALDRLIRDGAGVDERLLLPASLIVAAGWQASRAKRRALNACARIVPLRPRGWKADTSCARFGVIQGWRCVRSCWALMAVMVAAGHANLPWMVGLSAIVFAEERLRIGRRHLRAFAIALAGLAVVVAIGS